MPIPGIIRVHLQRLLFEGSISAGSVRVGLLSISRRIAPNASRSDLECGGSRRRFSVNFPQWFISFAFTKVDPVSALGYCLYLARPESGGGCHRTLRRPSPHHRTSASDPHSE